MNLATVHKKVSYDDVYRIVNSSLGGEQSLYPLLKLRELGVDEIDLADILFHLGFQPSRYFTDNKLNEQGIKACWDAVCQKFRENDLDTIHTLVKLKDRGVEGLIDILTLTDLYHLANSVTA